METKAVKLILYTSILKETQIEKPPEPPEELSYSTKESS